MSKAAIFFVEDFEEAEAVTPTDILRRGNVTADTVSLTGNKTVTGSHGIKLICDKLFEEISVASYDMLVLPGGPGTESYMLREDFLRLIREAAKSGVKIGAICAAPSILGRLGLLKGKKAVCYPGYEKYLEGADVLTENAVTDGNITTSRGMGTAADFGFELLEILEGTEMKNKIKSAVVYPR
ncbi:MAG: DJ-1/PfpI family protein [Clostridiales bacterium]|jgi:4-methyl-5(b-hydroxyethyl)-thiazole monophosphate biosynthesis|nr:DJ-1/PfpI family protein [Clostridiales bacterium]